MDTKRNEKIRKILNEEFPVYHQKPIAEEMNLYLSDLSSFRTGSIDFGEARLARVEKYLTKRGIKV